MPKLLTALSLSVVLCAFAPPATAQQPQESFQSQLRLENEQVRVMELRYAPGGMAPRHVHEFPRVVYVVEGGTVEMVSPRGDTARVELLAGQTVWRPAETHSVRNVGDTVVRVIETEVKCPPEPEAHSAATALAEDRHRMTRRISVERTTTVTPTATL